MAQGIPSAPVLGPVSLPPDPACSSGCPEKRCLEGNRKHMQMYANEPRLLESIWAEAITVNGGLDSTSLNRQPLAPSSKKLHFPSPKISHCSPYVYESIFGSPGAKRWRH